MELYDTMVVDCCFKGLLESSNLDDNQFAHNLRGILSSPTPRCGSHYKYRCDSLSEYLILRIDIREPLFIPSSANEEVVRYVTHFKRDSSTYTFLKCDYKMLEKMLKEV